MMLAPNPIFTRADELSDLYAPACVDIFAVRRRRAVPA